MSERKLKENQKDPEEAAAYEPCCDWVLHPSNKALRTNIVAGARRLPGNTTAGSKSKYAHKQFLFVTDKDCKAEQLFFQQSKKVESQKETQKDNLPAAEKAYTASTFPDLKGPIEEPSALQGHKWTRAKLAREAISIIDKIVPPQPTPKSLAGALEASDATAWAKA